METPESMPPTEPTPPAGPAPDGAAVRLPSEHALFAVLCVGLLAGGLAWLGGEYTQTAFKPPLSRVATGPIVRMTATTEAVLRTDAKNATMTFALLGATIAMCLGAVGGIVSGSTGRAAVAAFAGLVLGGLAGGGASLPLLPLYYSQLVPDPNDLMLPLMVLGGVWATIGLVAGLMYGAGLGSMRFALTAAGGGFLGAVLGTILYLVFSEVLIPDMLPMEPLPAAWQARLLARMQLAVFVALGAAMGARPGHKRAAVTASPAPSAA